MKDKMILDIDKIAKYYYSLNDIKGVYYKRLNLKFIKLDLFILYTIIYFTCAFYFDSILLSVALVFLYIEFGSIVVDKLEKFNEKREILAEQNKINEIKNTLLSSLDDLSCIDYFNFYADYESDIKKKKCLFIKQSFNNVLEHDDKLKVLNKSRIKPEDTRLIHSLYNFESYELDEVIYQIFRLELLEEPKNIRFYSKDIINLHHENFRTIQNS